MLWWILLQCSGCVFRSGHFLHVYMSSGNLVNMMRCVVWCWYLRPAVLAVSCYRVDTGLLLFFSTCLFLHVINGVMP